MIATGEGSLRGFSGCGCCCFGWNTGVGGGVLAGMAVGLGGRHGIEDGCTKIGAGWMATGEVSLSGFRGLGCCCFGWGTGASGVVFASTPTSLLLPSYTFSSDTFSNIAFPSVASIVAFHGAGNSLILPSNVPTSHRMIVVRT